MRSASKWTALSALALALALAPAAHAGTLFIDGATLVYLSSNDEMHELRVTDVGPRFRFSDAFSVLTDPGANCDQDGTAVLCTRAAFALVYVVLDDLPDRFVNETSLASFACGGGGRDVLVGGRGHDDLAGGAGRDEIAGGPSNDTLVANGIPPNLCPVPDGAWTGEVLDGGEGLDLIHGSAAADVLIGGGGNDSLRGYAGDDRLSGGDGEDDIAGFAGDDEIAGDGDRDFLFGGDGADRVQGGDGDDFLGLTAVLDADGPLGSDATTTIAETGDDVLDGGPGDDTLIAGPGERTYDPRDVLGVERRGDGDRTLQSAAPNGADVLRGGDGYDRVSYFNRAVPVRVSPDGIADDGMAGEGDRVETDVEEITGGAGADTLVARPEGSALAGDLGADRLAGADGPDLLRGGTDGGADVLLGAGGADDLGGGGGDDRLEGGAGGDVVAGDDGEDVLHGDAGADTLAGGTGADRLEGGSGADCLHGFQPSASQAGCPAFAAAAAATGADGADTLAGGDGVDRLGGGDGEDVADYADATGPVLAALAGVDPGAAAYERPWSDRDEIAADVEGLRGGPRGDTLLGDARDNLLDGGPGDDHLDGGAGSDRLRGGPGRDVVLARDGTADELRCGSARDLAAIDAEDEVVTLRADVCELVDGEQRSALTRVVGSPACPARVRLPGMGRSFRLPTAIAVPWGTRVLTERCGAAVQRPGESRIAQVTGGSFSIERPALVLRGGGAGCARGSRAELRRLSVTTGPALRVAGRWAGVRASNAAFTIADRCDGTRVSVSRGRARLPGHGVLRAPAARLVRR